MKPASQGAQRHPPPTPSGGGGRNLPPLHRRGPGGGCRCSSGTARRILTAAILLLPALGFAQTDDVFRQFYLGRYTEVVKMVQQEPGKVNWREPITNRTLLMLATDSGIKGLVEFLVAAKSDINATDAQGDAAITFAAVKGFVPLVEFLAAKGARLDLYAAVALDNTNELTRVLKARSPWQQGVPAPRDKPAPLMLASRYNHLASMKVLLAAGAVVNERNKAGRQIIHEATQRNQLDQIALLLEHGAEIDDRTTGQETPLHIGAAASTPATVQYLLDKGADIKLADWNDRTAVHWAVLGNQPANLKLLLEKGGNPSDACVDGTPLHIAIWKHGNLEIVKLLVEHQADLAAKDSSGRTPLQLARRYRRDTIAQYLAEHGAM